MQNTLERNFARIQNVNPALAAKIKKQCFFIDANDAVQLEEIDRLMNVLVRCGCGRFTCAVQNLKHFMTIIEEHAKLKSEKTGLPMQGDYIRDVALAS